MADVYELWIPRARKEWLNANDRRGWQARRRVTASWRADGQAAAWIYQTPHMDGADITAYLTFADKRRRDPNNWAPTAKALIDGLVDADVFDDDDDTRVTGPDMRIDPTPASEQGIRLVLTPRERRV